MDTVKKIVLILLFFGLARVMALNAPQPEQLTRNDLAVSTAAIDTLWNNEAIFAFSQPSDTLAAEKEAEEENSEGTDAADEKEPEKTTTSPATEVAPKEPETRTQEMGRLVDGIPQPPDVSNIISFGKIFWAIIFILLGYFIIKAISGILILISERRVEYKSNIRRTLPVIKIAGWSFVFYIIISGIFQPPAETIFAFFASVGVAIGFASQDLLKNIFGGLMILFDKPFQIGDKIESGKYYGEVMEVGLRSTRVVTPDDSIVTIPNSEMMNQSISNANSSENNCQVVAEFFLPVITDTKRARQIAIEAAQVSRYVYLNKPIFVEYSNVLVPRGSFLKMRLKAYVMDVRYEFPFQSEMTEVVLREFRKEGILDGL